MEVHQLELEKLSIQIRESKRNSRLVSGAGQKCSPPTLGAPHNLELVTVEKQSGSLLIEHAVCGCAVHLSSSLCSVPHFCSTSDPARSLLGTMSVVYVPGVFSLPPLPQNLGTLCCYGQQLA